MIDKIRKYIEANALLDSDATHIVALSGGADSVCLLRIMLQLNYKVQAVHCNFHLRGAESDRDEKFCKELCKKLGVTLHLAHFDTRAYATHHRVSIEMAARELRYTYFEQLRDAIDAADIVVAHHRNDNVETMLMNLIRGTGIKGLQGIKPRNGHIIRPMLTVSKEDIIDYLATYRQDYITDSSNLVDDVMRNKIRLNIIPMLKEINPAVMENMSRTIENISESTKIVDYAIEQSIESCTETAESFLTISRRKLLAQPSPEQTLFAILSPYGFSPKQIKQISENLNVQAGRTWHSAEWTIASDRGTFIIGKKLDKDFGTPTRLPETGTYYIYKRQIKITATIDEKTANFHPYKEQYGITIDADKVMFPITIRSIRNGDRFHPFGMRGEKLVSDYITDKKRNYFQRSQQLLVEDATGNIIWIVGERISQKVICDNQTIKVLTLRYYRQKA